MNHHQLEKPHPLHYTIHSCSSCSSTFHPFNIIEDCPLDSSSRWSGSGPPNPSIRHNPSTNLASSSDNGSEIHDPSALSYPGQLPKKKEYIIIDLGKPCIVRSVTFGKFHRPHPCNVKLFRIWGSLAPGEGKGDFKALLDDQQTQSSIPNSSEAHDSFIRTGSQQGSHPSTQSGTSSKQKDTLLGTSHLEDRVNGKSINKTQSASRSQLQTVKVRGERHRSGPRMELLAQGELKNDPVSETVQLRWRNNQVAWYKTNTNYYSIDPTQHNRQSTGIIIPVRYLKLEPLSAAGSNYNCSIWHVAVSGHDEEDLIIPALQQYEKWRASAALRLCLKHLRQTGHLEAFEALLKSSALPDHSPTLVAPPIEKPFQSSLPSKLSSSPPTTDKAEEIVRNAALGGLFDHWARGEPPNLTCLEIHPSSHALGRWPCPRGGHQMCIDSKRRKIWLFGGFDGYGDLADLWVYHLPPLDEDKLDLPSKQKMKMRGDHVEEVKTGWELISPDVEEQNGPMSRSCHKMILDELTGDLYVLGRYTERLRNAEIEVSYTGHYQNDFFRFTPFSEPSSTQFLVNGDGHIGQWECISRDTESDGGPKLIFDHQMVLDSDTRKIYVFGGKVIRPNWRPPLPGDSNTDSTLQAKTSLSATQYSGLYEYDLNSKIWTKLMDDTNSPVESNEANVIPSRMGHALVLDKKRQSLWILTGERDGHYYSDLWRYHLPTRQSELITADYSTRNHQNQGNPGDSEDWSISEQVGPEPGFSQRTTFDEQRDEWHMFCGLCRDRNGTSGSGNGNGTKKGEMMSSEFWRWRIEEGKWTRVVMMADHEGTNAPPPRFAHQMVFDELTNHHYVFGGNPADSDNEPIRLGDFWRLNLVQATPDEALRRCLFGIRRQQFIEMCLTTDAVTALTYLQVDLSAVTNHCDELEAKMFRACTSYLLTTNERSAHYDLEFQEEEEESELLSSRRTLFEGLLKYFPKSMTEPDESLMDLVDVWGDRETFW
ncbi:hypothetical protein DFH28DRAFT_894055 [Melampsora americana]|nr:hypothetical protein DFH28DRAFT_894055 [Melampsora americana]